MDNPHQSHSQSTSQASKKRIELRLRLVTGRST